MNFDFPFNPFLKASFNNVKKINKNTTRFLEQNFFLYSRDGWGSLSKIDFLKKESENRIYFFNTQIQYLHDRDTWEAVQKLSKINIIDENTSIKNTLGIALDLSNKSFIETIWINSKLKRNIYNNWIFISVTPEIAMKKEYGYKADFGIFLGLEVIFAKKNQLNSFLSRY